MFRVNIDKRMVNTGTKAKPFISAAVECREYFCGSIRYFSVVVEKTMDNIGDDSRPYFVKTFESVRVKVLGIRFNYKEQSWKHDKL